MCVNWSIETFAQFSTNTRAHHRNIPGLIELYELNRFYSMIRKFILISLTQFTFNFSLKNVYSETFAHVCGSLQFDLITEKNKYVESSRIDVQYVQHVGKLDWRRSHQCQLDWYKEWCVRWKATYCLWYFGGMKIARWRIEFHVFCVNAQRIGQQHTTRNLGKCILSIEIDIQTTENRKQKWWKHHIWNEKRLIELADIQFVAICLWWNCMQQLLLLPYKDNGASTNNNSDQQSAESISFISAVGRYKRC